MAGNFLEVGQQFAQHYYSTFASNRAGLSALYSDQSMMTYEGNQFQGAAAITAHINGLPLKSVRYGKQTLDCQPSPPGGILVYVTGEMFVDDSPNPLKFAQVFHLVQSASGNFFILNDMFRLNIG
mmetsp:Transcript_46206/g.81291  ORF Transcript_46206/g.81291 Transcript_46206/m.81291 type:complete len:125 (-) Transcript_46206:96-470(-)